MSTPSEYEPRLDELFLEAFDTNHPAMHDWALIKMELRNLRNTINDLTLSLSMWIEGYPFDDDHRCKQRKMIENACMLIGKPRTMEELAVLCELDDEHIALARQHDEAV